MSVLSLSLALLVSAGQAPAAPPPPSWPAGIEAKPRAELPWVVAAIAIPIDQPPALLPLVASWLEQPESWAEGPVARLLAAGGVVRARAFADGLVVVAEGPAERQGDVVAASLALLGDAAPSKRGFGPARAEALAFAAQDDDEAAARQALWRAWYGEAAAKARAGASEEALLAATLPDLSAALDDVKRRSFGHKLFLEGPVDPGALPSVVGALRPAWAPSGPPSLPRPLARQGEDGVREPAHDGSPAVGEGAAAGAPAPRLLVVGHPLPPGPWSSVVGYAFTRALERRLAPLGEATAVVESGRHARLLVVTLRPKAPAEGTAATYEQARAAIESALATAREEAARDRALDGDLAAAAAGLARDERRLGAWAERQALAHLTGPAAALTEAPKDALVGLLRISVLPEVLRAARAPLTTAERRARSAASARGPG